MMTAQSRIASAELLQLERVEPTVLLVQTAQGLEQAVDITIANAGPKTEAILAVDLPSSELHVDINPVDVGRRTYRIYIPDIRQPVPVQFALSTQGRVQSRHAMTWQPQRHWCIYMVHYSHHDLGYTDLPTDVLREHDGFMDDVLRFCEETDDWPEESRFRYLVEQAWSLVHFIENRPGRSWISSCATSKRDGSR